MRLLRHRASDAARAYESSEVPGPDTPWREAPFAVVDLETTGLDPRRSEIISFASVPVTGGRAQIGSAAYAIVRPKRMPAAKTIRIHGLREADLESARPLAEAVELIFEALAGRVLVAHAAWVERGFLQRAFSAHGARLREPVLDTAVLARRAPPPPGEPRPRDPSVEPGLSTDARSLGLPIHRPHHADGDALTTAQLFIALATRLDRVEEQTIGSLARLSEP